MFILQFILQVISVPGIIILSIEICKMYAAMWREVLHD